MKIIRSICELRSWRKTTPQGEAIGFVPTMGALHEGHLSLVRASQKKCRHTVVSIFVNPLQFGPKEDLKLYPRSIEKDIECLEQEKIDVLFLPHEKEILSDFLSTFVSENRVSLPLCGAFRPGHFQGVLTIVMKLFNLVRPDFSFFGQKDAQQCAVIEKMVKDLHLSTQIIRCPTLREKDGLALSSRNAYLLPIEREKATNLFQSLLAVQQAWEQGERNPLRLSSIGRIHLESRVSSLESHVLLNIQYYEIRHPQTLEPLKEIGSEGALVAVAVLLGCARLTRLIDNITLA